MSDTYINTEDFEKLTVSDYTEVDESEYDYSSTIVFPVKKSYRLLLEDSNILLFSNDNKNSKFIIQNNSIFEYTKDMYNTIREHKITDMYANYGLLSNYNESFKNLIGEQFFGKKQTLQGFLKKKGWFISPEETIVFVKTLPCPNCGSKHASYVDGENMFCNSCVPRDEEGDILEVFNHVELGFRI